MEPERNIEKELKAFAEQRRADAGTPPGLHPVNRRELQAEVARSAKSASGQTRSFWQILFGSGPRLVATGIAAAIVVLATMFVISSQKSGHRDVHQELAEMPMTKDYAANRDRSPVAATPPPPGAVFAPRRQMSKGGSEPIASVETKTLAPVNAPVAVPAPPTATFSGLASATNSVSSRAVGGFALDYAGALPATPAKGAALSVPARGFSGIGAIDGPVATIVQPFRRADISGSLADRPGIIGNSNLLTTFQVEQALEKLRVIDSDGSVYTGFVVQTPEIARSSSGSLLKESAKKDLEKVADKAPLNLPVQAYHFRVSGTNRTLQEEVVFTGNFLTHSVATPSVSTPVAADALGGAVTPSGAGEAGLPLELQKASLQGQLLLGGSNKIEINAVPTRP